VKNDDESTHYLVKWRSLPYDECTWELAADIDNDKIQAFLQVCEPPSESDRKVSVLFDERNCNFSQVLYFTNCLNFCCTGLQVVNNSRI
jgi:Chromo (CHRromatin Organisation MOdifier) domain